MSSDLVIVTSPIHAGCESWCLRCGHRFRLRAATVAMTVEGEALGMFCPSCLTSGMRKQLAMTERRLVR